MLSDNDGFATKLELIPFFIFFFFVLYVLLLVGCSLITEDIWLGPYECLIVVMNYGDGSGCRLLV